MEFIGILIIIIIVASLWQKLKSLFFDNERHASAHTHQRDHHGIEVGCPYCHENVSIDDSGLWTCSYCNNTFEYDGQEAHRVKDVLLPGERVLVELFAKIAKADGIVTKAEIIKIDTIIKTEFQPSAVVMIEIRDVFNQEKKSSYGYQAIIHDMYSIFRNEPNGLMSIIYYLFEISLVDDYLDERQEDIIRYAANQFHLGQQYDDIKAKILGNGYSSSSSNSRKSTADSKMANYYDVLDCQPNDSLDTVKKNYRRLIKEYHPDRFMNKDLPSDFIKLANRKIQAIQEAYEAICKYKQAN